MAFGSLIPPHPHIPLSSPPSSPLISSASFLPTLQFRNHLHSRFNFHRVEACLSSRFDSHRVEAPFSSSKLQPSNEESPEAEPPSNTVQKNTTTKKKKRKPRPSFYDQTLEHWSIRISSQRSKFPWQEEQQSEEKKVALQPHLSDDFPSTGISLDHPFGACAVAAPWTHGAKPRKPQLGSKAETQNPVKNVEFDGEGVNTRLDLIVRKLNGTHLNEGLPSASSDDASRLNSKNTARRSSPTVGESHVFTTPVGLRRVVAPWAHGRESRDETPKPLENVNFDGENGMGGAGSIDEKLNRSLTQIHPNSDAEDASKSNKNTLLPHHSKEIIPSATDTFDAPLVNGVIESLISRLDPGGETRFPLKGHESNAEGERSSVSSIVEKLKGSLDQDFPDVDGGSSFGKSDDDLVPNSVSLPWERKSGISKGERLRNRSNTEIAEKTIPEPELRRLRDVSLRMKERMKVGPAGVTEAVVESIHEKWKEAEVVKIKFEGPPSLNMKRTHEALERKTGGLVIWRSGSSLVLYQGLTYKLPCVQLYSKLSDTKDVQLSNDSTLDLMGVSKKPDDDSMTSFPYPSVGSTDTSDVDSLLDQLGPRFKDWSGCNPLPVDADLLPGLVPGYKTPFRLLPYKTRSCLKDRQMTSFRRLARTVPPHFALGRNRQHQGLAHAMVKLWEKSAIAKIAIKRGVPNTCNERMAEEIKKLTGGILVSRNNEYIVFYRGNDFLPPSIREVLIEKQKLATIKQDDEEVARLRASASMVSNDKTVKGPLVAGTLAETKEANTRWGNQPSNEDLENMRRDLVLAQHTSLVTYLERKLAFAKAKVRKAEKALAKVQEFLNPAELPTDLETVTDEERFLFRKIGLKMRAFLLIGRRQVFDGTIQNMHLNWKHRELVKIFVKGKNFAQVKHIAISLEAESGGVLISLDKTTKGYMIIIYRGKNYHRPQILRPKNLLTRRQALARSIELQRREALNHHISNLRIRIQTMKSQLDQMVADEKLGNKDLDLQVDNGFLSDDDVEDEGEEAYLETYSSSEDDDGVSEEAF